MLKILGILVGGVLVLAGLGVGFLTVRKPAQRVASAEKVEITAARLARGKYLAEHVVHCVGCHSALDTESYGMPIKAGTVGQGGLPFDEKAGFPGYVCAQNITSDADYGLGGWSDGEIMRAFREGVDRSGDALFPMMPYTYYRSMSDEDARSVLAYLRSIPAIHNPIPPKHLPFPINLAIKGAPQPEEGPVETPDDAKDHLAYGKYLVTLAGCEECHTPHDARGQRIQEQSFAGGWTVRLQQGDKLISIVPPNITPDPDAFFGWATKDQWVGLVRSYADLEGAPPKADPGRNTFMAWVEYAGMTDRDLAAIYDYMKTVKPIHNEVDPFPDARSD